MSSRRLLLRSCLGLPLLFGRVAEAQEPGTDAGVANTGAANTGAANTGAANTGAANTGGANTGAANTGAASTGAASTGAASTGAASTGAASTGAASTGAASTGAAKPTASNPGPVDTGPVDTGTGDSELTDESAGERNYAQLSLDDLLSIEIDASALRPHTLDDAPATVYVIPASLIQRRGYTHLTALLEDIPEFEMAMKSAAGDGQTITIRGVTGNQKLTVLMDGVKISTTTGTPIAINQNFSLADAKRVEVVLGPSSALYGADAFSAVVNIVTFRGDEIKGGKLSASYGQYRTTDDSVVVGTSEGDFSIALTASGYHSNEPNLAEAYPDKFTWYNNQYKNAGNVRVSPFAPPDAVVHVGAEPYATPTDAHFLNLRLTLGDFEFGLIRHGTTNSSSYGTKPEYILYVDRAKWGYDIETAYVRHKKSFLDNKLELRTGMSLASFQINPDSMFINNYSNYTPAYKYGADSSGSVEATATYHVNKRLDISGGAVYETFSSLPKTTDLAKKYDPDTAAISQNLIYPGTNITDVNGKDLTQYVDIYNVSYRNVGAFAEVFARLHDKVALTAGARFDHNTRYGSTINPRAGLVIGPFNHTRAKLLYGEAFYAPSTYFAYQHYGAFVPDTDPNTGDVIGLKSFFWHLPNPDLQPEKLRMVEASISHHTSMIHVSANGYYQRITDLITEGFSGPSTFKGYPVETIAQFVNRGEASMYGGTARAELNFPVGDFTLNPYAAYTLSDGDIDGKKLPYAAKHTVKAGLDVAWRNLSLSTRAIGRSSATHASLTDANMNPAVTDGSVVFNTHFLASDLVKNDQFSLAAYLDVRNLLDARYSYVAGDAVNGFADGAPQDPRRIMIGVVGSFKQ